MKLKGINPFEQHVEKIVVGAVGVGVLGVVAWQLLGQSTITVGTTQVPLASAYSAVDNEALKLKAAAENANPKIPAGIDLAPLSTYTSGLTQPLTPSTPLPTMAPALVLGPSGGATAGQAVYAGLIAPRPTALAAAQFRGTVQPAEKVAIPELVPFLPKEQPYDKAAVSVEARFDGKALRQALENDPDGAGPQSALPIDWWINKTEIIGVEVEREEQNESGAWGQATTLPTLPGRLDFLKQWKEQVREAADVEKMLPEAGRQADDIQRPKYYAMMFGDWVEPGVLLSRAAANFDPNLFKQLSDQYSQKQKDLKKAEDDLKALPPDPKAGDQQPGGGGKGAPGPAGGGKGGERDPRRPNTPAPNEDTPQQKRAKLNNEISKLKSAMKDLARRMKEMGGTVPEEGAAVGPEAPPAASSETGVKKGLLEEGDHKLFAHDITAEPGKTYRYRLRVVLNNPMYGRDIVLKKDDQEQAKLAQSSMVSSEWTDWSDPVSVDRDAYWFITGTNNDQLRQNIPTARAEMFQFYYGFYRRAEVALEPGDPVIGKADLPNNLWIFDEKHLGDANPAGGGPAGENGQPRGPGKGGGAGRPPGREEGPAGQPPKEATDPNKKAGPKELRFTDTSKVIFLDVRSVPGSDERSMAILRSHEGAVVSKYPDRDKKSDVYKRVAASAEAGNLVSKPPEAEKPKGPQKPQEQPTSPERGKGGGGGGLGGG